MTAPAFAIVTPCYKETSDVLERMAKSVIAQTIPCHHILVTDGVGRRLDESLAALYRANGHTLTVLNLPTRLNNSGAGPRAIGAAFAFSKGVTLVSFLDADNALLPDHAASVSARREEGVVAITSGRRVFLKDTGEETPLEPVEHAGQHIDTNCLTLTSDGQDLLSVWLFWPTSFGTGEDRILSAILNAENRRKVSTDRRTVLYWSEWPIHYRLAGRPTPENARRPSRRAATHFHAESFFRVIGARPIANLWQNIACGAMPALANEPFVAQCHDARSYQVSAPRFSEPPLIFCDLIIRSCGGDLASEVATNPNQPVFDAKGNLSLTQLTALASVMGYHTGNAKIVLFLPESAERSERLHKRVVDAVSQLRGNGVVFIRKQDGEQLVLFAIAMNTTLGGLISAMLSQPATDALNWTQTSVSSLEAPIRKLCTTYGVATAEHTLV